MDKNIEGRQEKFEFDSVNVGAYIIDYAKGTGKTLNATQVQKILYCCYGVTLALTGKRLTKEHPQAWPFGPVFFRVYSALSKRKIQPGDGEIVAQSLPENLIYRINKTIEFFSQFKPSKLSAWSHRAGSPWDMATDNGRTVPVRMDDLAILNYFKDKVVTKNLTLETSREVPTFR